MRPYDFLGRFGGDEFILCFPNTKLKDALALLEEMRQHVEEMDVYHDSTPIEVTASFGAAEYQSEYGSDTNAFLDKADDLLYRAKQKRNFVYSEALM